MTRIRRFIELVKLYWIRLIVRSSGIIFFLILTQLNYQVILKFASRNPIDDPLFGTTYIYKESKVVEPVKYVVFCTSTPNGESHRSYDYAYNLPLTALAWERIGFKSIVPIIGSRCEWENDPALRLILSRLEERRGTAIFIDSPLEYRTTLSQTARIFVTNMEKFPGTDNDYLITSDADLWPLRKEHFIPRHNIDVVLIHWGCCGEFKMNNKSYSMYPMSNIGATVSTWKQIMNDNHSIAYDYQSILDYLVDVFGEKARSPVFVGEETWFMDQKIISIRLAEWMDIHGQSTIYRVSDKGFSRADRESWLEVEKLNSETFLTKFDSHLPGKGYLPVQQAKIKPLVDFMYGNNSWEAKWIDEYNEEFLTKVDNWIRFNTLE
jgi:hypothetical protein